MRYLCTLIFLSMAFSGRCDFESYFEIKLNQVSIYNSVKAAEQRIQMPYDSLQETDLFEIKYYECGISPKNYYELHVKVEGTTVDLTFISDEPSFILNMGWFTQFRNKKATIYFHHTKYGTNSSQEFIHKIVDLYIA